jgi:uncharacterized protein YndB with AHSA1/START domain
MEATEKTNITVSVRVDVPLEKVWKMWTDPGDIIHWNHASEDWHSPKAENDLRSGGRFNYRMEARDGSMGFDFWGIYEKVIVQNEIGYTMGDGRKAAVGFSPEETGTRIIETFEAEETNSIELQRTGWQAILDNFKKYAETH